MADYATLKAAIQAVIYENGNQEITGSVMQATLLAMVNSLGANYQYAGIATPSTNPGTPDQNVFYLAGTAGTYVNFGNIVLAENEVAILKYNGSWTKEVAGLASAEKVNQLDQKVEWADVPVSPGYTNTNGTSISATNRNGSATVRSVVIPVSAGDKVRIFGKAGTSNYYRFYATANSSLTIVEKYTGSGNFRTIPMEVTIPSGVAYIAVNFTDYDASKDKVLVWRSSFTTVQDSFNELKNELAGKRTPSYSFTVGYIGTTGNIGTSNEYAYTSPIELKKGETITVVSRGYSYAPISLVVGGTYSPVAVVSSNPGSGVSVTSTYTALADCLVAACVKCVEPYDIFIGTLISQMEENIEDLLSDELGWPKKYGKEDCVFEGKTADRQYTYVFPVNDYVRAIAYAPNGYTCIAANYTDYLNAKNNGTTGRTTFGDGYDSSKYGDTARQFRIGDSHIERGFIAFHIIKNSSLTDADIVAIRSGFHLEFYPKSSIVKIQDNEEKALLANSQSVGLSLLWPFICNSGGAVVTGNTRVKFFDMEFTGRKLISVDISSLLTSIPRLVYSFGVWSTQLGAEATASATLIEVADGGWKSYAVQDYPIYSPGIFSLYLKKSDDSEFTIAEFEAIRAGLNFSMRNIQDNQDVTDRKEIRELPIGNFVRGSGTGSTLSESTKVVSACMICVPILGVSYTVKLPIGLQARFVYGNSNSLGSASAWTDPDGQIELPGNAMIQRLQFQKSNEADLTIEEVAAWIASGGIKITYPVNDLPVAERNYDAEKYVKAALFRLGWTSEEITVYQGLHSMPMFVHISDLHGDVARLADAAEYSKMLAADAVIVSGDSVVYNSTDGSSFLKDVMDSIGGKLISCIGNHEVLPKNTITETALFNNHISPYVAANNWEQSPGTPTTHPYYFVDFPAKSIRVIVLNQYDNGCYFGEGLGGRLGQSQVTWFCDTLLSTPAGYGVIIVMHSPEDYIDVPESMAAWNQTVNWDGTDEDQTGYARNGLYVNSMRPIKTIVDAFISKTALDTSYEENTVNGNNGETVNIDADFSNVAEGVEFICYITGHRHKDCMGYIHTAANKQFIINIVCGNCHYTRAANLSFSEGADLPRGDTGVTQDAFNVFAIDRQNGRVKVARVGSSVNFEGIERKFLLAPYKDLNQ